MKKVVFSNRAYNAIICETYNRINTETGGILLGHIQNNTFYIIEAIDPGSVHSIFEKYYFEYDEEYVNNLSNVLALQYGEGMTLCGLWHRHPDSLDVFSSQDYETNELFARQNPNGIISCLVNVDPEFRLTVYDVGINPLEYTKIPHEFGDNLVPDHFFKLRYVNNGVACFPHYETKKGIISNMTDIVSNFLKKHKTEKMMTNISKQLAKEECCIADLKKLELLESEVNGKSLNYNVKMLGESDTINFTVTYDNYPTMLFEADNQSFPFGEGIFKRYIKSKENGQAFNG